MKWMPALPQSAPKFAQITGVIVTSIVVLGSDTGLLLAVPLGILAGAMATFFASLPGRKRIANSE